MTPNGFKNGIVEDGINLMCLLISDKKSTQINPLGFISLKRYFINAVRIFPMQKQLI